MNLLNKTYVKLRTVNYSQNKHGHAMAAMAGSSCSGANAKVKTVQCTQ